jgi:cob(I)alamin adenosyltransferase
MSIYTKKGDDGTTGLIGGTRVSKDDIRLESYGSLDELNSFLGLLLCEELDKSDEEIIRDVQNQLFVIGSWLATDLSVTDPYFKTPVSDDVVKKIEKAIDLISDQLPVLKGFILPGGNKTSSLCHVCRTICRRSERIIIRYSKTCNVDSMILTYINRLSDYLFILGRKASIKGGKEIFWNSSK